MNTQTLPANKYTHHWYDERLSPQVAAAPAVRSLLTSCTSLALDAGTRSCGGSPPGRPTPAPNVGPTLCSRASCGSQRATFQN